MFIQDDCVFLYVHMISKQVIALWVTRTIIFDVYMSDMLWLWLYRVYYLGRWGLDLEFTQMKHLIFPKLGQFNSSCIFNSYTDNTVLHKQ